MPKSKRGESALRAGQGPHPMPMPDGVRKPEKALPLRCGSTAPSSLREESWGPKADTHTALAGGICRPAVVGVQLEGPETRGGHELSSPGLAARQ